MERDAVICWISLMVVQRYDVQVSTVIVVSECSEVSIMAGSFDTIPRLRENVDLFIGSWLLEGSPETHKRDNGRPSAHAANNERMVNNALINYKMVQKENIKCVMWPY